MTGRRELRIAVGLCILGSALVLLALSRVWLSARLPAVAPLPARTVSLRGTQLAPGARALALVGLAGTAALPAARRTGRLVVGVLLVAAGAGAVAILVRAVADPTGAVLRSNHPIDGSFALPGRLGSWPYVGLVGGVLLLAAGLLAVVRGRRWAAMSARYEPPAPAATTEGSLWESLDRGEDPTDRRHERDG